MLSQNFLYSGREEPVAEGVSLTRGPLSFSFDPEWASIRSVQVRGKVALLAVYAAVRDQYWNTVKPRLSNLRIVQTEDAVEIDFDAQCRQREVDFAWKGHIRGDAEGTLTFRMDGEAQAPFLKNRIGFCVLHPLECTGRACRLEKVDGSIQTARFPYFISPHQPFQNLRAISYELLSGLTVETRLEGDIFETEDQRNWTDASYKTYCTPLSRPFPVPIDRGDQVRQSVTVRLLGQLPDRGSVPHLSSIQSTVALVGTESFPLPRLGLCLSAESFADNEAAFRRLHHLHLAHLRLDVQVGREGWEEVLAEGARQAEKLGTALELAVHLSRDAERDLSLLASQLLALRPCLAACLVFGVGERSSRPELIELARGALTTVLKGVPLGGGSNVYFTELNRNRPSPETLDIACYPVTPQVHAFDDLSLLETPPVQAWTVETARTFLGSVPVAVTPITLKPRTNPNVAGEATGKPGVIPGSVDARQVSLLGAVWTLASIKYLAESGAASITYYETLGGKGVMETEQGTVYPLYHVFADIGEYRGGAVIPVISSMRPGVEGLLLQKEGRRRMILGNSTRLVQPVQVYGCGLNGFVRVRVLDETTAEEASLRPESYREAPGLLMEVRDDRLTLALLPYATVTVDSVKEETNA